jgi:hypothetical protein
MFDNVIGAGEKFLQCFGGRAFYSLILMVQQFNQSFFFHQHCSTHLGFGFLNTAKTFIIIYYSLVKSTMRDKKIVVSCLAPYSFPLFIPSLLDPTDPWKKCLMDILFPGKITVDTLRIFFSGEKSPLILYRHFSSTKNPGRHSTDVFSLRKISVETFSCLFTPKKSPGKKGPGEKKKKATQSFRRRRLRFARRAPLPLTIDN